MKISREVKPRVGGEHRATVRLLATVLAAASLGCRAGREQKTGAEDLQPLTAGLRIERELAGDQVHSYGLQLDAGQLARVRVRQRGADVVLTLYSADHTIVRQSDGLSDSWGTEIVSVAAESSTSYTVAVQAGAAAAGRYELFVEALRPLLESDASLLATDEAMAAAAQSYSPSDGDGLRRAITGFRQALETWRRIGDEGREAETLFALGACYGSSGLNRNEEALATFEPALALFRSRADQRGTARTLYQIGRARATLGHPREAMASYLEALDLWRRLGDFRSQGPALNDVGNLHREAGRIREARGFYEQALALFRQAGDESREIAVLNNLAGVYGELGEPDLAAKYYQLVLAKARELGRRRLEATVLNNLGFLTRRSWEPQQALIYYRQARALSRTLDDRRGEASALHNLGFLYHHLGQSQRGLELLEEALTARREVRTRRGEATTLSTLGEVYATLGEMPRAREALEQALELRVEIGDRDGEAETRSTLSAVYAELGDFERAAGQLDKALAIEEAGESRLLSSTILWRLGNVRAATGAPEQAADAYRRSLELARAARSSEATARALQALGRLEADGGRLPAAREHLEAALREIETARARVVDPELRSAYFGRQQSAHELYVDVLMRMAGEGGDPDLVGKALEASERARARTLTELLAEAGSGIYRGIDPQLAERRRRLSRRLNAKALQAMQAGEGSPESEHLRREIQQLLDEQSLVDSRIRSRPPPSSPLLEPPQLTVDDLRTSLLDDSTMLLEYALGDERSYLWAVTAGGLAGFVLPPRAEIEDRARTAYELLATLDSEGRQARCRALAELGEMLLGPLAGGLGERRLVVVPDGVLHYLPFAAFATPGAPQPADPCRLPPLIESHEIVTQPSAAAILELRSRSRHREPAPRTLAILADPVFRADDPRLEAAAAAARSPADSGEPGLELARLPWSRREAGAIAAVAAEFDRGEIFQALDFAANRRAVERLGEFRFVHFATHGVLDSRHPELSGLALSLVDETGRPEDGFLRLHDIYNLDLRAELVVLSGCRTALGREIRGEGLVGLTRGFFYAGAKRVAGSLWAVDDRATAELMGRFYRRLLQGGSSPAAALRAAQRDLLRRPRWRDPYYWAAFTVQGEWAAVAD